MGEGLQRAVHAYKKAGTYAVTLVVTDDKGLKDEASQQVTIGAKALPVASLDSPALAFATQQLTFDASGSSDADGKIAAYEIDFGDGSAKAREPKALHAFAVPGYYTVTLTVTDNDGASAKQTRAVNVQTAAALAERNLAMARVGFSEGALGGLDLAAAQRAAVEARLAELNARYDYHLAAVQLAWAAGSP